MAESYSELAAKLWPYLQRKISGDSGGTTIIQASTADLLKTDGTRSLLGDLTVAAGKTIDGVDISTIPSTYTPLSRTVTAGDGMTGGGNLGADITLNVVGGSGIRANANSLDLIGAGTVTLASTNNTSGSHTHAITTSSDPGAAAAILATNASGSATLVSLALTSNLETSRVNSHLIPAATDTYDIGSTSLLWRKGYLSELDTIIFAQLTETLHGGWDMWCKDQGKLAYPVLALNTTINWGQAMTPGDIVVMRGIGQVEYIQVGTLDTGTTYINNVRDRDGSGANAWPQGTPFAVLGTTGNGRVEIQAYDTPRLQVFTKTGTAYNAEAEEIRIGDLNGWGTYAAETMGMAVGRAGSANMTWDSTNGLRLRNGATTNIQFYNTGSAVITGTLNISGTSGSIAIGNPPPTSPTSGTGILINRDAIYGLSGSAQQTKMSAADGTITAGSSVMDATGVRLNIASGYQAISAYKFVGSGSTLSQLRAYDSGNISYVELTSGSSTFTRSSHVDLTAYAKSADGYDAAVALQAHNGAAFTSLVLENSVASGSQLSFDGMRFNISAGGLNVGPTTSATPGTIFTTAGIVAGSAISAPGLNIDSNTLYVDAANNRIGINTALPNVPLEIAGNAARVTNSGSHCYMQLNPTYGDQYLDGLRPGGSMIIRTSVSSGGDTNAVTITPAGAMTVVGVISGSAIRATKDSGGAASTITITNVSSSTISTGSGTLRMSGSTARTNTDWIKVWVGTGARYIPAWTTIT